jgi:CHAD domain-containing protein
MKKVPIRELRRIAARLDGLLATLATKETSLTARGRIVTARPWQWALDARVARRASVLANRMAGAGAMYLSERLHAVRIAVKKLRYALELSADVAGQKTTPELVQLRRAQEVLGRLHDLQVLVDLTRETQASLTPPDLRVWRELDLLVVSLDEDCRRLHGRYVHDAPALEALCARLGASRPGMDARVRSERSAVKR